MTEPHDRAGLRARGWPRGLAPRRARGLALVAFAVVAAGCSTFTPGAPVVVMTSDNATRYEGERSRRFGDSVSLTSSSGSDCGGDLHPTTETETGRPAAFGGILCEDGASGILLFSGDPASEGGLVSGVMRSRSVSGHWGSPSAGLGSGV